jgi:23S rRNA (cytosine1962-C5)-methyltransferase
MSAATIQLRAGREKPLLHGHPWIFSGAINEWNGRPETGDAVDIFSSDGEWIARGLAHPASGLPVRAYTRNREQMLDANFFAAKIDTAIALRKKLFDESQTDAYRLVYSEADGLSGLMVDRYGDSLAVRISAAALQPHLGGIVDHLRAATGIQRIHVGTDKENVEREGLDQRALERFATFDGKISVIKQDGFRFEVDISGGQKTGFYLDQRVNRARVAAYSAKRRVLSCYCYTGALEVYLDRAGAAEIVAMDSSGPALEQARRHAEMNAVKTSVEWRDADVPLALRKFRDQARSFDLIVLDPPKFVLNASQKDKGLRAYKDINLLAMKLLAPGGILATFSCSGLVSRDDLKMVLGWSAKDANRSVQILEQVGQPPDHPVLVGVPESEYLCGFICAVG